jgi:broad specificity phosphatase PhoE
MTAIYFVTHPEVVIDPQRPVPRWHLSDNGIACMRSFATSPAMRGVGSVWASTETKAIEAAGGILAGELGLAVAVDVRLDENDRSATGYLPPAEFQRVADAFFARPNESVRGWERAIDAQRRVVAAFDAIVAKPATGDTAIVAHGGVGTLLLCHLSNLPISRDHDQSSQGHYWSYSTRTQSMLHGWRSISAA